MSSPLDEAVKLRYLRRLMAEGLAAVARGDYDDLTSEEEVEAYFQALEQAAEARNRLPRADDAGGIGPQGIPGDGP